MFAKLFASAGVGNFKSVKVFSTAGSLQTTCPVLLRSAGKQDRTLMWTDSAGGRLRGLDSSKKVSVKHPVFLSPQISARVKWAEVSSMPVYILKAESQRAILRSRKTRSDAPYLGGSGRRCRGASSAASVGDGPSLLCRTGAQDRRTARSTTHFMEPPE